MEDPKSNLQRRSSFPPRLQRRATLHQRLQRCSSLRSPRSTNIGGGHRIPNKSNPYVGWFRHAPDTSFLPQHRLNGKRTRHLFPTFLDDVKTSPYIGWFRHAPPSRLYLPSKELHQLDQELAALLKRKSIKDLKEVSGHLKGGAPSSFHTQKFLAIHQSLHESSDSAPSATVKVLMRLASWFLFPIAHDAESCGYRHDEHRIDVDKVFPLVLPSSIRSALGEDDESRFSSSTEDDSTVNTVPNDFSDDLGDEFEISVSSLAEAYYAHQAEKEIDQSTSTEIDEDGQRLDYVITQMDIARMARNASRHLDVASILSLPTMTYRSKTPPMPLRENDPGWSWMIVHEDGRNPEEQATPIEDDTTVCVICLEQFNDGDRLRVLPCDHSFHVGCIDRWLSGSHSFEDCYTSGCPTCKKRPETAVESREDGSVPAWAFTRIGDSLAKDEVRIS